MGGDRAGDIRDHAEHEPGAMVGSDGWEVNTNKAIGKPEAKPMDRWWDYQTVGVEVTVHIPTGSLQAEGQVP